MTMGPGAFPDLRKRALAKKAAVAFWDAVLERFYPHKMLENKRDD